MVNNSFLKATLLVRCFVYYSLYEEIIFPFLMFADCTNCYHKRAILPIRGDLLFQVWLR